ncbi:MAG: hypothetical protein GY781_17485 [Gammaproteobacteria bacterium]|nr:hypothetical protein [Gammaproteobacteria bacterium]
MGKLIDYKNYPIAIKIALWGATLLLLLFVTAMVNNRQVRTMGAEFRLLKTEEIPVITAINNLNSLIYQQTILRHQITAFSPGMSDDGSSEPLSIKIDRYNELSPEIINVHQLVSHLMKNYARLEMRATKARWLRLQNERQKDLDASLANMTTLLKQQNQLAAQTFQFIRDTHVSEAINLQQQLTDLDKLLHQELELLLQATYNGIITSEKKLHHMEYGAIQLSIFLLFWFILIGAILGYFTIRAIVRRINNATTFARQIAEAEDCGITEVNNTDELGQLMQQLNKLVPPHTTK